MYGIGLENVSGLRLDLAGYDIICDEVPPAKCAYPAVAMSAAGSNHVITRTGSAESVISGPFDTGIDCNLSPNSSVGSITVLGAIWGISDCYYVGGTVIGPAYTSLWGANWGISTTSTATSLGAAGQFYENFISGRTIPISTSGSTIIGGNIIDTTGAPYGIYVGGSGLISQIDHNVFFGTGYNSSSQVITVSGTDAGVYDANFCAIDHPGCASCIASARQRCEPYTSHFRGLL